MGYKPEKIPRNVKNCVNCGHCNFGCSHDSKQSVIKTLLEPLLLRQARQQQPNAGQGNNSMILCLVCTKRMVANGGFYQASFTLFQIVKLTVSC